MRAVFSVLLLLVGTVGQAANPPPTVAILYFDYDGTDDELVTLRKGITQMLITDLSGREAYRVVERPRLQEALAELDLSKRRAIDPASALKVGKLLQARFVVVGGYFVMGKTMRIDARIYETETTATLKGVAATGKVDDFFSLEQQLAGGLDSVLSSSAVKREAPKRPSPKALAKSAQGPVPLTVVARYSRALESIDTKQPEKARPVLNELVKSHPDFLLARLSLAELSQ